MVAGLYVAHHRWLDSEFGAGQLFKVGHSGCLARRLLDSSYVTCFPEGWRYVATFVAASKEEAQLLETAVLHACQHYRVDGRELVRLPLERILEVAARAALKVATRVTEPPMPAPGVLPDDDTEADNIYDLPAAVSSAWTALKGQIEVIPAEVAPTSDDFIDDLLGSWDFTAVRAALPPPEPVVPVPVADKGATDKGATDMIIDEMDDPAFASAMEGVLTSEYSGRIELELRPYQREAVEAAAAELERRRSTILQMACRCGKTPVAFGVISGYGGAVCVLVPGLSLLRQTAQKMRQYGYEHPIILVGSDTRPVSVSGISTQSAEQLSMTTSATEISQFCHAGGPRMAISTYQSSGLLPTDAFELTVFDECHRICGGKALRPFNQMLLAPQVGARLFMTATPAYETSMAINMKNRAVFGGVAYRYHLRQGIAAGYVNDFRLELVVAPPGATAEAQLAAQILQASAQAEKLLVFCRDIRHATNLCEAVRASALAGCPAAADCLTAHSRMSSGAAAEALRHFAEPGRRAILFNVRLFQEGVEIPALNGIFFAAPRHSPRDIIQSLCRPLNRVEGKPQSLVFLPLTADPALAADDPANLQRYVSIVPFVDALLEEDPRLYEHLLDPGAAGYPLGCTFVLGARTERPALLAAVRRVVRYGTGSSRTERLLRSENVPWDRAFAELQRIVTTCGRYPKTTDAWHVGEAKVCLHRFYRRCADQYRLWLDTGKCALEPHQLRDLESLRDWELFGVEGPYPWKRCMEFLDDYITTHGEVPMCEINKGGYVGLEATWVERLSGALTCVNQQVFGKKTGGVVKTACRVPADHQADLDALCAKHGLRWRKQFKPDGVVDPKFPTFIQESFARFKAHVKVHGVDDPAYVQRWFPGYPHKHAKQESLEVQQSGVAPPRWKTQRRADDKNMSDE